MKQTIWFDMDGTIANLYGVENWLEQLCAYDPKPYREAGVMLNMNKLARTLNKLRRAGYKIGIISWLSKCSTPEYDTAVTEAKLWWLHKHLTSVEWDAIKIVAYGTSKITECGGGILFDDEDKNRATWGNGAYEPDKIFEILSSLLV